MRWYGSHAALIALALLGAEACGSPDPDSLSLVAQLSNPELEVEELALGARLKGGFELALEVGAQAPNGAEVSIESFAIVREAATLVAPLQAIPEQVTFPLWVDKGERKAVHFALDDSRLIENAERDELCAKSVRIVGSIRDSLSGGNLTTLSTGEVVPACP
jgi:hypothetical protein